MKKKSFLATALLAAACSAFGDADADKSNDLVISADRMAVDNVTATVVASGHVRAVSHPMTLLADSAEKRGDHYCFAPGTLITTCTNETSWLHWSGRGTVYFHGQQGARYVVVKNMWLRLFEVPVLWFPYWYYPMDTDYGWRVMPGYMSKWGPFLLTKYVYHLAGDGEPEGFNLSGSTRFDVRTKNGVALGQGLNWQLGPFGSGRFKVYYAWDEDYDHYDRNWKNTKKYNYQNWESTVPHERYSLMLEHRWEATERDTIRLKGAYVSDTRFKSDFLRDTLFGHSNRFCGYDGNEIAWEHVEKSFGLGLSVSGPLNDFYGGTARLPELYFDTVPQPVFTLPINWESSSRAGFLNRNYKEIGKSTTAIPYRYDPGRWADYQTFRFDTYHRLTAPFKVADVLSVVPRIGLRGTFYDQTGDGNITELLAGTSRAGRGSDQVWRSIVEGGVTFAARGTADFGDGWNHLIEPYLDVLFQEADYHGLKDGSRPFIFDSHDASMDWLDQFAGRSRNLPYTWHGMTPGLRNVFRKTDESGRLRTIFDFDVYAAVQFNETEWYGANNKRKKLVEDPSDPNYGEDAGQIMPGVRLRWFPDKKSQLSARAEYDGENDTIAYADISWRQIVNQAFNYQISYVKRNHRWWDYGVSPTTSKMKEDLFNQMRFSYLDVTFEYELCDAVLMSPFIRVDCTEPQIDEIGSSLDLRTDCLGFRIMCAYANDYERVDGSEYRHDWRVGFYIYLRAFGPEIASPLK